jgi:acetyl-CoA carboxylase biotin carboxyl carrier protein
LFCERGLNLNSKNDIKKPKFPASTGDENPMDVGLLQQLVNLMAANDLNTVDVRDGGKRIILKRGAAQFVTTSAMPMTAHAPAPASGSAPPPAPASAEANLHTIKSPMVGTFYFASSPEAKPLASVGMHVDDDTDVCIIEAMKVFNNIKAECKGTITKILVTNGQTVEFGQPLFLVKQS